MILVIGSCFHKESREMIIVQALDIFVRRLFNLSPIIAHKRKRSSIWSRWSRGTIVDSRDFDHQQKKGKMNNCGIVKVHWGRTVYLLLMDHAICIF